MPRAKSSGKDAPRQGQPEWGGFIDVRLTPEEAADFAAWYPENQLTDLDNVLGEGVKAAVSFDAGSDTYLATLTSDQAVHDGRRYVLTARAGLWEKALGLALYKHLVMLEREWGRFKPSNGRVAEVD